MRWGVSYGLTSPHRRVCGPVPLTCRLPLKGGVMMKGGINVLQYPEAVFEDFVVPEAQDLVALLSQTLIAVFVVDVLFRMLAAVEFDEQFLGHAGEVDDVRAYRLLAAEFVATELFVAQVMPEAAFGVDLAFSEEFGLFGGSGGCIDV